MWCQYISHFCIQCIAIKATFRQLQLDDLFGERFVTLITNWPGPIRLPFTVHVLPLIPFILRFIMKRLNFIRKIVQKTQVSLLLVREMHFRHRRDYFSCAKLRNGSFNSLAFKYFKQIQGQQSHNPYFATIFLYKLMVKKEI